MDNDTENDNDYELWIMIMTKIMIVNNDERAGLKSASGKLSGMSRKDCKPVM